MPAIVTQEQRVKSADQLLYSLKSKPVYAYLSRTTPWDDETAPPTPIDSTEGQNSAMDEVLGLKRITTEDAVSVVPRVNWTSGVVYDQYDHRVDMIRDLNPETSSFYKFYVLTEDFNVYKCLSNSYRSPSTDRPTGTDPNSFRTPDGYVWKYMYTIQSSDVFKFMTTNWMPCYTLLYNDGSAQWNSQRAATPGAISVIQVTTFGTGYNSLNPPTVTIDGDGTGAQATASVNDFTGEVEDIIVTDAGRDYTTATVTITDSVSTGLGAEADAIIAPRGGHGFDPKVELGANYVMTSVPIDGSEGGTIKTGVKFRVAGLIQMPRHASETCNAIKVDDLDSSSFRTGDTITGETSGATANVISVDIQDGVIYVDPIAGNLIQSEMISSNGNNLTEVLSVNIESTPLVASSVPPEDINKLSGRILYTVNRTYVSRVENQQEDIIAIFTF